MCTLGVRHSIMFYPVTSTCLCLCPECWSLTAKECICPDCSCHKWTVPPAPEVDLTDPHMD